MALLVDEARWMWRGRRWAHLVSDTSIDELHDFAERVGLRYLSFGLDHYDVSADNRLRVVELGARPVPSRVVVRELRAAGLRVGGGRAIRAWRLLVDEPAPARLPIALAADGGRPRGFFDWVSVREATAATCRSLSTDGGQIERVAVFTRPGELLALVTGDGLGDGGRATGPVDRGGRSPDRVRRTTGEGRDHLELIWSDPSRRYRARP